MNNIITISGDPGSGKSTVRNALKKYYEEQGKKVILYSVGDIFRDLAEKQGMSVTEFNQFLERNNCSVDKNIDNAVKKFGQRVMEENDESKIYLIDSRVAWYEIPESFKIRLTTTDRIAGQRVFEDKTRGEEDKYATLEEAIEITRKRKESERKRYIDLYDVDLQHLEQYDLVIDTSFAKPQDIAEIIVKCLVARKEGKEFARYWKSPKQFMPIQKAEETFTNNAHSHMTLEQWKEKIAKDGVDIDQPITAIKVGETYFVRDGHHRNFGAAYAGKTLVPYEVKWTDNSDYNGITTRQFITYSVLGDRHYDRDLYVYEDIINMAKADDEKAFYYSLIYPGIEKGKIYEGCSKTDTENGTHGDDGDRLQFTAQNKKAP